MSDKQEEKRYTLEELSQLTGIKRPVMEALVASGGVGEALSPRERDVYRVIDETMTETGKPPTVRQIAKEIGVRSPATVKTHLDGLEGKGYLVREGGKYARGLTILRDLPDKRSK